ncbi:MAG: hypothetical protein CL840_18165 [Crocinitomicaceae bacterium]|nr:hypothetical protein [Crocinitomicaceae bacterium]
MNLIILKTNLRDELQVESIQSVLSTHPHISDWSVDTEDIDNVLRIEAKNMLTEEDVIQLIQAHGFSCEVLPN